MGNTIEVYRQKEEYKDQVEKAKKYIKKLLAYYNITEAHVALFFISSQKMRVLNRTFRGKDRATNVLTFVEPKDFIHVSKREHLGEIYINPAYIKKRNQSLAHMIVHGFLHLQGYDHRNNREERGMIKEEEKLLAYLWDRSEER